MYIVVQHSLLIGAGSVAAVMFVPYLATRFLPRRWRAQVRHHAFAGKMGSVGIAVVALVSPALLALA